MSDTFVPMTADLVSLALQAMRTGRLSGQTLPIRRRQRSASMMVRASLPAVWLPFWLL